MRHALPFCAAFALATGAVATAGCAPISSKTTAQSRTAATVKAEVPAEPIADAAGTWDWVFRSSDEGGNLRVEQEEWHLRQQGRALDGYYDRAVTRLSTDDRLFKCNQQLGYTVFTRVRVAGAVEGDRLLLRELSHEEHPGPCDDGARSLLSYEGEVSPTAIKLSWAAHKGQQTLYKREGKGPALAQLVGFDDKPTHQLPRAVRSNLPVSGVWQWELKSVDAEGDERIEREEWHLTETDDGIAGFYDRSVSRVRGDGSFTCNHEGRYETTTRYQIDGHRFGDVVTLTEASYTAGKNPCDNGLRRLDTYQGSVAGGGDELILSWGAGNQVLRRKDTNK